MQYKRFGRDKDDLFYSFGKVHGLENIVYVPDEDLKKIDNPIDLQKALNKVEPQGDHFESFEQFLQDKY